MTVMKGIEKGGVTPSLSQTNLSRLALQEQTDERTPDDARKAQYAVAALLIAQFLCMFGAAGVLGAAIHWPQSLDYPAAQMLPVLVQKASAVNQGYLLYFTSAVLLALIAILLPSALPGTFGRGSVVVGVLAGALKTLGIIRWLTVMPLLAADFAAATTPQSRESLSFLYDALNRYGGGVGEYLGVMLFTGVWTLIISFSGLRSRTLPRLVCYLGFAAGAGLLVGLVELAGVNLGGAFLTISGVAWQVWAFVLAVSLLWNRVFRFFGKENLS